MENYVLRNRGKLKEHNYIRKGDPEQDYWFDFSEGELNRYKRKYGDSFNLIIYGSESSEMDFYVIPYSTIKHMLNSDSLYRGRRRWVGSIVKHDFRIRRCPTTLSVGNNYGKLSLIAD